MTQNNSNNPLKTKQPKANQSEKLRVIAYSMDLVIISFKNKIYNFFISIILYKKYLSIN